MVEGMRREAGEAIARRRRELGLTLGQVAQEMEVSDGYVWKLEKGLVNLRNISYGRMRALLKALRWTPEEFTQATGIPVPGLTAEEVPGAPPVPLLKVPLVGSKEYLILGLPGWEVDPRNLRAMVHEKGFAIFREGTEPQPGELAIAQRMDTSELRFVRFLGLNSRRSYVVEGPDGAAPPLTLEKKDWTLHQVVGEVRVHRD